MATIRRKVISFFLIVGIVPTVLISLYFYFSSIAVIRSDMLKNKTISLTNTMSRFDNEMASLIELTDWIFLDKNINTLLSEPPQDRAVYSHMLADAADSIANHVSVSRISGFLSSLYVLGDNGLDLRYSNTSPAYVVKRSELLEAEWVGRGKSDTGLPYWADPIPPLNVYFEDLYLIPMVRSIIDVDTNRILGTVIALVNERIFNEIYIAFSLAPHEHLLFVYESGVIFSASDERRIGSTLDVGKIAHRGVYRDTDGDYIVAAADSPDRDWRIINLVPTVTIRTQQARALVVACVLFLVSLLLIAVLSGFLTSNLNGPISALIRKVERLSIEDLPKPAQPTRENEIGLLERSIDSMSMRIRHLMEDKLLQEREKHDIELRLLRSQINPHFLYNTLNTVRWMAVLQRADGIARMVSALSKILRYAVGKMSDEVTLREEIEMLEEYLHVQTMADKRGIAYEKGVAEQTLLDCPVMKFSLQPIVENSILHGIRPKMSGGLVRLDVERMGDHLRIRITDNGMGIPPDRLVALANDADLEDKRTHAGGLRNVRRRIQLLYGARHGLEVSSEFGKGTVVTLDMPVDSGSKTDPGVGSA